MKMLLSLVMLTSFSAMADADSCAVAFNSLDRDYTSRLVIKNGDRIRNLNQVMLETGGDWDNRISAVSVKQGCTLIAYQYQNFNTEYYSNRPLDGFAQVFENPTRRGFKFFPLTSETNEMISSLKCYCPNF